MAITPTAIKGDYRKVIVAKYDGKACKTCGATIRAGIDFAATQDFKTWVNYCEGCASDHGRQIDAMYAKLRTYVEALADVPATVVDAITAVNEARAQYAAAPTAEVAAAVKAALYAARAVVKALTPEAPAAPAPTAGKIEPGIYRSTVDTDWSGWWWVKLNKAGTRTYAMRMMSAPVEGRKHDWDYVQGGMSIIARSCRPATAEELAELGEQSHYCCFCSTELTDRDPGHSIDRGYGPICANRYGLPWG